MENEPIVGASELNSDIATLALALSTPVIFAIALTGIALTFSHPIGQVALATVAASTAITLIIRRLVRRRYHN